jgi:hypothetical protein
VKINSRSVIFAAAGAALAVGGVAAPATADAYHGGASAAAGLSGTTVTVHHRGDGTKAPAELGNPSEWGEVTFTMNAAPAGTVAPLSEACTNPSSGGTWCYGWYSTGLTPPQKFCYSNYLHDTKGHASTVKLAGGTRRVHAAAGDVSEANLTAGFAYTCSTYYSID